MLHCLLLILGLNLAHAALPVGFTPPAVLTAGPWAVIDTFNAPPRYHQRTSRRTEQLLRQVVRVLRPFSNERRPIRPADQYVALRRLAEQIVVDSSFSADEPEYHNMIARGLYLVSVLESEYPNTSTEGKGFGALLLGNAFISGHKWSNFNPRLSLTRIAQGFPADGAVADFVRLATGPVPGISSPSMRYRLARAMAVLLIWEESQILPTENAKEAWTVVRQLPEQPYGNDQANLAAIDALERLRIMPHAHMQENLRPFTPNSFSEHRALLRGAYHYLFAKAYQCGEVVCATADSAGAVYFERGELDGRVQEALIAQCLAGRSGDGPFCRGVLTCNRQTEEVADRYACIASQALPVGHRLSNWHE